MRVSTTRLLLTLPLVGFLALAAVFAFRVTDGKDRSVVPSALVGQQVPAETFPALLNDMPGVDPARLSVRGLGPSRPRASNDTAEGRSLNRRVEVLVTR